MMISKYFPKPAELRGAVSELLVDRRRSENERRLRERALPEADWPEHTEEDRQYVDERVRRAKEILGRVLSKPGA